MKGNRYVVCFPARNEEKFLPKVLDALENQTIKPVRVIIANDGSTDKTEEIARAYDFVDIHNREKREKTVVGKIEMGKVWNDSITPAEKYNSQEPLDYIVFLGGDMILPNTYVEDCISKFDEDPKLMIASGIMVGENAYKPTGFMIPGPGRIMRYDYWLHVGGKYPLMQGWEAYPVYQAQIDGYNTKFFTDIEYHPMRPTGGRTDFHAYGQAMKAYGYFFPFAIGRALKQIFMKKRGLKACFNMIRGYLFSKPDLYSDEIRNFVRNTQKTRMRKVIFRR